MKLSVINADWNDICELAEAGYHPSNDARHAMGNYLIIEKNNIAAVQRQLGYNIPTYSMQYARITDQELSDVLDDR